MAVKNKIEMDCIYSKKIGYSLYRNGIGAVQRLYLTNLSVEGFNDCVLSVSSEPEFLVPNRTTLTLLPKDRKVEIDLRLFQLSPYVLGGLTEPVKGTFTLRLSLGDKPLAEQRFETELLPPETYAGRDSYPELLAGYVKPKQPSVTQVLKDAQRVLKEWKMPSELGGYEGCSKNAVRQKAAAVFTALQAYELKRSDLILNTDRPVPLKSYLKIKEDGICSDLEMALFFAACLEGAGINPLMILSKESAMVAFWLTDTCLMECVSDDMSLLKKRMSDGINEIVGVDISSLYAGAGLNFAGSEKSCVNRLNLKNDQWDEIVDIKRCRLGGIRPLPEKVALGGKQELVDEEDMRIGAKPKDIREQSIELSVKGKATRERQWERRLLDLSLRNSLLNFKANSNSLHIVSVNIPDLSAALLKGQDLSVEEIPHDSTGMLKKAPDFGGTFQTETLKELIRIELSHGRLRSFSEGKAMEGTLSTLYRRDRTALEETGVGTLFVAAGFLKWAEDAYDQPKYAPLILFPVQMLKKAGGKGYAVKMREEECHFNSTLLEFLLQEFGIDIRGLGELKPGEVDFTDILSAVSRAVMHMKGWVVSEDVYLASYSFSRFLMWNDIRYHMEDFSKNKIVQSLINNRSELSNKELRIPDLDVDRDFKPDEILTPIRADASQFSAVAASMSGKSFVLHGPPGTGKSQTITNIIANAVYHGKNVLFVAEKMAALSVVKKRLDDIGIGDFCLELHSNKVNKCEVADKLVRTLNLPKAKKTKAFAYAAENVSEMRKALNAEIEALHTPGKLGISVYQGILRYEENKGAPDCMDIESTFFDSLTPESFEKYESMLSEVTAAAAECGEVYRSPFEDIALYDYSEELREKVLCTCRVFREEIARLSHYADMCFDTFRHRVRKLTRSKLNALVNLCSMLTETDSPYRKIFGSEQNLKCVDLLKEYSRLYKKYDKLNKDYLNWYKSLIEPTDDLKVLRADYNDFRHDYKRSRPLKNLVKRMDRMAKGRLDEVKRAENIDLFLDIYETRDLLKEQANRVAEVFAGGKTLSKAAAEDMLQKLDELYRTAEDLFSEYDFDAFNSVCIRMYRSFPNGYLTALLRAHTDFLSAERAFKSLLSLESDYSALDEDILDYYSGKAAALIENIDLLPAWCKFRKACREMEQKGLTFALRPLLDGRIKSDALISGFRKKFYEYFVQTSIRENETLSRFSGGEMDEKIDKFRKVCNDFEELTRTEIRQRLLEGLPSPDTEGVLSLEMLQLSRLAKSGMRGYTLRKLFAEIPNLLSKVAPCMLMSPITVSQYLEPKYGLFDLVVFDEASQMPTSEAVGVLARGKNVIVVGDPKQLPPTTFFTTDYSDEENPENEDLESILEDCLALGIPEKHLLWHYRSKHESLIAFSNSMYYGNKLHTFPSPDALESKVTLRHVDGVYDRGETKQNRKEAEALVAEIVRRLKDPELNRYSIGVVTFSTAQQDIVEDLLSDALIKEKLENRAYNREEPIFVKNLENVQGDERDVILFSVGYGPDKYGKLTQNFGPINQAAGWRRLNVAASRARAEMIVFSSMTAGMLDLSKSNSKGVAGLKAFLEFADKGKTALALRQDSVELPQKSIGYFIAQQLKSYGYECVCDLGVSDFRIDCAVCDPKNKKNFILAILADGTCAYHSTSAKDRTVSQVQTLKMLGWNVYRLWTLNFHYNPKREAKRIKDYLDKITGNAVARKRGKVVLKYRIDYRTAALKTVLVDSDYLFKAENEKVILQKLSGIVAAEQPIAKSLLIKRCLTVLGILRSGVKINRRMEELLAKLTLPTEELDGTVFYYRDDTFRSCDFFRAEDPSKLKRAENEICPYEIVAAVRSVLEERISLQESDLVKEVAAAMNLKLTGPMEDRIRFSVSLAMKKGYLTLTNNDYLTLI